MNLSLKNIISKISSAIIIFAVVGNMQLNVAQADFTMLTPCKDSTSFQKRLNTSIKKLENRLKLYKENTSESEFLLKEINATKARFERYGKSNLLCGKEGLPRIIASGQWDHVNEFVLPGVLFLYITGWIGWVGRKYVQYASTTENPFENEIIINIPVALSIMNAGFLWPLDAWKEFITNNLLASDDDITVSPR